MDKLLLWENAPCFDEKFGLEPPCLLPYICKGSKIAVIVIPGGAYGGRAEDHEGVPTAERLVREGISAFILRYRHSPYRYPIPKLDVCRAVRMVRYLASKEDFDADKIAVLGFSAGGHLAALAATQFEPAHPDGRKPADALRDLGRVEDDEIDALSSRPDAAVLCYPVITLDNEFAHHGSAVNLIGEQDEDSKAGRQGRWRTAASELSIENGVRPDTPPCFIWHTAADSAVPVENSLMLAAALSKQKVPFEAHIFPYGDHGLGLATETCPHAAVWMDLCVRFLRMMLDPQ